MPPYSFCVSPAADIRGRPGCWKSLQKTNNFPFSGCYQFTTRQVSGVYPSRSIGRSTRTRSPLSL